MARRMKAATVLAWRSKSRARRRKRLSQAKVRSTIQHLGKGSNPKAVGERSTISMVQHPRLGRGSHGFWPLIAAIAINEREQTTRGAVEHQRVALLHTMLLNEDIPSVAPGRQSVRVVVPKMALIPGRCRP